MQWNIPGTVLSAPVEETCQIEQRFRAMFLGGGIVLSQIASITGLEPYAIQNWVKRGFLSKPQGKKYTLNQFCRILNINMLKDALQMEEICGLMTYINGQLDDESDDLIDDSQLYFLFLCIAAHYRQTNDPEDMEQYICETLEDYRDQMLHERVRVKKVLEVMLTAWAAALLRQKAVSMVAGLKND